MVEDVWNVFLIFSLRLREEVSYVLVVCLHLESEEGENRLKTQPAATRSSCDVVFILWWCFRAGSLFASAMKTDKKFLDWTTLDTKQRFSYPETFPHFTADPLKRQQLIKNQSHASSNLNNNYNCSELAGKVAQEKAASVSLARLFICKITSLLTTNSFQLFSWIQLRAVLLSAWHIFEIFFFIAVWSVNYHSST